MATVQVPSRGGLLLSGVSWEAYEKLLRIFDEHPAVRLTYDRGELEIMTLTHEHETLGHFLGRLVIVLTEELLLPVKGGGSTTFKRKKKQRGLEPDECFWIANELTVRNKNRIRLQVDPPPDLAIEIDITHSSLNRQSIYAAIRVPEIWRFDRQTLAFLILGAGRKYTLWVESLTFPGLKPEDLIPFLAMRGQADDNAVVRQFRAWVQQRIAAGWQ